MELYEFIDNLGKKALKELMPLGISRERVLKDDPDHEYLLFTGYLYQITPYLEGLRNILEKVEPLEERLFSLYKIMENGIWHFIKPVEKDRFYSIVRRAYSLLKEKIDIGYDYSIDYYSGIIFHDMGSDVFEDYAKKIIKIINNKKLVTIDPHTTYALKVLYPEVDKNFNAEIYHYTEFLNLSDVSDFVDHESCYLNRYLKIKYGSDAIKPQASGKESGCCGGPIEFVSPRLATEIARSRMDELLSTGKKNVIVWCPICLSNLSRLRKGNVYDALELINQ
ncbi:MAG: heterodisulfide reductase-related iron-sulfur binding cluster [Thermoplasmata archaeon]